MATTVKCPRCGKICNSDDRTIIGNVERTAGYMVGAASGLVVNSLLASILPFKPHTMTSSIVRDAIPSEFKCACGHVFHAKPLK